MSGSTGQVVGLYRDDDAGLVDNLFGGEIVFLGDGDERGEGKPPLDFVGVFREGLTGEGCPLVAGCVASPELSSAAVIKGQSTLVDTRLVTL